MEMKIIGLWKAVLISAFFKNAKATRNAHTRDGVLFYVWAKKQKWWNGGMGNDETAEKKPKS